MRGEERRRHEENSARHLAGLELQNLLIRHIFKSPSSIVVEELYCMKSVL
jgi:hypothetical protein